MEESIALAKLGGYQPSIDDIALYEQIIIGEISHEEAIKENQA